MCVCACVRSTLHSLSAFDREDVCGIVNTRTHTHTPTEGLQMTVDTTKCHI